MQEIYKDVTFLVGKASVIENMHNCPSLPIFSETILYFLQTLSKELLHNPQAKAYGDIIAYAFWIRRVSLEKSFDEYRGEKERIGRGVAYQITPSNIPVQFAVSMTYALISGNISVIRASNKYFKQVEIICEAINKVIERSCVNMVSYICIFRSTHEAEVNQFMSKNCDIRMIWGGDATIDKIRKVQLKPKGLDLGFADRYSLAVIQSDDYLSSDEQYKEYVATDFYNDSYYTDQNACSATRLVFWLGNNVEKAKSEFWKRAESVALKKYEMSEISSSDKLLNIALHAAKHPGIKVIKNNNILIRVEIPDIFEDVMNFKGNCGLFMEYKADTLENILPLLRDECQTVTYLGNLEEELRDLVKRNGVRGVDRIVPMGHSMDLSFVWDGYDLPITLSRKVNNQ